MEMQKIRIQFHYLYSITNLINGKVYIGQTVDLSKRWYDHRKVVQTNKPTQIVHRALIKYGLNNFKFEVIATCRNQDDANHIEIELIKQYNSYVENGQGYNATYGGFNAPKTEEFRQMMRNWHANLSLEEKEKRAEIHRKAMINLIETKGHPCQGRKWSEEEHLKQKKTRETLDYDKIYTKEIREKFSKSHIGKEIPLEQRQKMADGIKASWEVRNAKRHEIFNIRCCVEDCDVSGTNKGYLLVNGARYCKIHGARMKKNGDLELRPSYKFPSIKLTDEQLESIKNDERSNSVVAKEYNVSPEFIRKLRKLINPTFVFKIKVPHNKINFTEEQMNEILYSNMATKPLAKKFGVSFNVIKRLRVKATHQKI